MGKVPMMHSQGYHPCKSENACESKFPYLGLTPGVPPPPIGPWHWWQTPISDKCLGCEVTGVSNSGLGGLLDGITLTEALKNAFADSNVSGINLGALPRTSDTCTQLPSISD